MSVGAHPELALIYAVPNGELRSKGTAGKLKSQGVKPGVPDLVLPVARGGYFGMYIEMKRQRGGSLSPDQKWWRDQLIDQGYYWHVFKGFRAAEPKILEYLSWVSTKHYLTKDIYTPTMESS